MNKNKPCSKCIEIKDFSLFSTNKQAKDGLHSWCKQCDNKQRIENKDKYRIAQKIYAQNNPEKIKKWKETSKLNPEFKAKKYQSDKKYREKMGDVLKEKKRIYAEKNYEKVKESKRREYQKNKQGYIARAYQRLNNIKCLTPLDADKNAIQEFYIKAKELTVATGIKHEVDHIMPISKGGLHHQNNLQVLPWIENRKKGNKIMELNNATKP
jgi:5-methylcytosine-specific restriction endonuclease McrA